MSITLTTVREKELTKIPHLIYSINGCNSKSQTYQRAPRICFGCPWRPADHVVSCHKASLETSDTDLGGGGGE